MTDQPKTVYEVLLHALLTKPPGVLSQSVGAQATWIQKCLEQHGYWIAPQSLNAQQEECVLQGLSMPTTSVSLPGRESITAFMAAYTYLMICECPDLILQEEVPDDDSDC